MKTPAQFKIKAKVLIILLLFICLIFVIAQPPHWRAGGNTGFGPDGVNTNNNILGTIGNLGIRFRTASTDRMRILGDDHIVTFLNTSAVPGYNLYIKI